MRYEELLKDPLGVCGLILGAVGSDPSPRFLTALDRLAIRPNVNTYRHRLIRGEQNCAWNRVRDAAATMGYRPPDND